MVTALTRVLKVSLAGILIAAAGVSCDGSTNPEQATLNIVSGNWQTGPQNTTLSEPIVAEIVRDDGDPLVGIRVGFSAGAASGEVVGADSITDGTGKISFQWQLGSNYTNSLLVYLSDQPETSVVVRAVASYLYVIPEETQDGWAVSSLTEEEMAIEPLASMMDEIRAGSYEEVHSVVIIKNDRLVFEEYFPGHDFGYSDTGFLGTLLNFDRDTRHNTHSATKSIISSLVGIAVDQGFIVNEDVSMFSFFNEYSSYNVEGKDEITIEHLLTMSSGLEWHEWDAPVGTSLNSIDQFNSSGDPIGYVLSQPLLHEPGTVFNYNGGTVNVLCQIAARAANSTVEVFADEYLFEPLGITNYTFPHVSSGFVVCHGDIYIRPRDMAKFGSLYLNGGLWQGQRIISEEWIQKSVVPSISLANWNLFWADTYGYLWWNKEYTVDGIGHDSFKALGWGGQEIMVFPEWDMVVVFTGANYSIDPPCDELLIRYILPSLH